MPLYDFKCRACHVTFEAIVKANSVLITHECKGLKLGEPRGLADRQVSCPAPPVMSAGRSAQSKREHAMKESQRLHARSEAYDKSPAGKQAREEQVAKLRKNGTIPSFMKDP